MSSGLTAHLLWVIIFGGNAIHGRRFTFAPNEGCISDGFEEPVIASILKETLKAETTSIGKGIFIVM